MVVVVSLCFASCRLVTTAGATVVEGLRNNASDVRQWQAHKLDPCSCVFGVLGFRCLTGSALLDCHVLKGFGIYMIGMLDS